MDVQHKKRGRPRLREEDSLREVAFGTSYPNGELYSSPNGVLSDSQAGHRKSKTYRELRSQPEILYTDQRPTVSDHTFPQQSYLNGNGMYPISPPTSTLLNEHIPTAILTPDFRVAQHNRAFSNALSLSFTARAQTLLDLVVSAEREKIQRLQAVMRAELRDLVHSRNGQSSQAAMPAIEHLDIAHATAGFRTHTEYWTFRLPREQTRGFPISISLAKDGAHFVVLTLVQSTTALHGLQSPPMQTLAHSAQMLPGASGHPISSSIYQSHTAHLSHHRHHRNSPSDVALPYLLSQTSPTYEEQMLQMQPTHSLAQYKQASPPRHSAVPYTTVRTNSGGSSGSSDIPRSSPGQQHRSLNSQNLRHLQLPPIRSAPTSDPSTQKTDQRVRHQVEIPSSGRSSPHSTTSGKRKKRRRVDIGGLLH